METKIVSLCGIILIAVVVIGMFGAAGFAQGLQGGSSSIAVSVSAPHHNVQYISNESAKCTSYGMIAVVSAAGNVTCVSR